MPAFVAWLVPPAIAVLTAVLVQKSVVRKRNRVTRLLEAPPQFATYVIGDLHGDADCASYWVDRTDLVQDGKWTDPSSNLVFLGDYIDKGPTSKQTVEYVKKLTEDFPNQVTALMGNHELELLRDRDLEGNKWRWGGVSYFQMGYSSAHPGEYLNFLDSVDEQDLVVVDALYNASLEVYGHGKHQKVFLSSEGNGRESILDYVEPKLRPLVKERMDLFQQKYIDAFRSGSELGTWLENLPVLAQVNESLFVHGGISPDSARRIQSLGVDKINQLLADNANEEKLSTFLDYTEEGRSVYDMVTYRGNHNEGACSYLPMLLPESVSRLGVGHTPGNMVRFLCDGNFLALDSALGRWFRNSGNDYCDGEKDRVSSNGRYGCQKKNEQCEGEIIRIDNESGEMYVLTVDGTESVF